MVLPALKIMAESFHFHIRFATKIVLQVCHQRLAFSRKSCIIKHKMERKHICDRLLNALVLAMETHLHVPQHLSSPLSACGHQVCSLRLRQFQIKNGRNHEKWIILLMIDSIQCMPTGSSCTKTFQFLIYNQCP